MNIRVLNYFLTVAKEENITRAAKLLHVTQPTLSRQLMHLEEELGVKLFQRSNHNIFLTNEGILFKRRAQELVTLVERAKKELNKTQEIAGEIAIGCVESQSMTELSEIMTAFRRKYPLVRFELRSGNNEDIKSWLDNGIIDLGLMLEPVRIDKLDYRRMERKDVWGILAHQKTNFSTQKVIHAEDLVGTPLITILDEAIHTELTNWSGKYAKQMIPIMHYNLLNNAATMVQKNAGVAVCLKPIGQYENITFIPFEPKLELGSILAWKEHQLFSKATECFIECAKQFKKEIQKINNC